MIKTADELKQQAIAKNITFYPVHNCSMCGYQCGYVIENDKVGYDSGCDCTYNAGGIELRDWDDLARSYNMNQPENNSRISPKFLDELNKTWQFDQNNG